MDESITSIPHAEHEQYDYYPLDTSAGYVLLADDHELVVTPQTGQITLVNWERRRFVTDCFFTAQEYAILLLLLEAWPTYAPTERLLEALECQVPDGQEQEMPLGFLRTLLAQCQERLQSLGLHTIPVGEQGFLLVRFQGTH
jgi:hypothetical protein